jgi:peptidoglycan hydrolase-like protein with peptidoglycan-binding domain
MEHTGFGYRGETVECSAGVQHFTKRSKKWTHWAVANGIDGDIPDVKPTLRRGDKGEWVTYLQIQLVNRGYDIGQTGVDGDFGRATEKAVKAFQGDNGLVQDGIVGKKTWDAIEQDEPALYTVTIPNLRKTAAETLVGQYPGATMTEQ